MKQRNGTTRELRPLPPTGVAGAAPELQAVVDASGVRTFVLVPVQRFEELSNAERALHALTAANDPAAEWVDADVSALRLAGSRLKRARVAKGLTQKEVARRLHIPQSQVSRIERDPDRSSLATLRRLAKALGVDVRALI